MKPNAWLEAWRQDIRRQLKRVGINKSSTPVVRVVISCERWRPNAEIWVGFMNPCLSWMGNDHDGCWKHLTNDDQGSLSHECWDGEPYIIVAHWWTNRIKQVKWWENMARLQLLLHKRSTPHHRATRWWFGNLCVDCWTINVQLSHLPTCRRPRRRPVGCIPVEPRAAAGIEEEASALKNMEETGPEWIWSGGTTIQAAQWCSWLKISPDQPSPAHSIT